MFLIGVKTPVFKFECLTLVEHFLHYVIVFAGPQQLADFLTAGRTNISDHNMTIPVIMTAYPRHNSTAVHASNSTRRHLLQNVPQSNAQDTTCEGPASNSRSHAPSK